MSAVYGTDGFMNSFAQYAPAQVVQPPFPQAIAMQGFPVPGHGGNDNAQGNGPNSMTNYGKRVNNAGGITDQFNGNQFKGQQGFTDQFNGNQYNNGNQYDGSDQYGWGFQPRQEYSVGKGPTYEQESLWQHEAPMDRPEEQVHVFGPHGEAVPEALPTFEAASYYFPPQLIRALEEAQFRAPTPIQAHTWGIALQGRDLIGVAKTGSGKTLAFLMPGFLKIMQMPLHPPQILVLAPTRELAQQIEQECERFGRFVGIRAACCYGGAPRGPQLGALRRGAQVVVGCPGRMNDFLDNSQIRLGNCTYVVMDEADRMLDMGFEPQIRKVLEHTPQQRQTLLFTATWPKEVQSLASDFLHRPIHVQTGKHDPLTANQDIEQHVVFCGSDMEKIQHLQNIISTMNYGDGCLVFCETKRNCEILSRTLSQYCRIGAARIHGDMEQRERNAALDSFKSGRCFCLVATDIAARGLDIPHVRVVINFDAAGTAKDYVHRIGRTGRAGEKGIAHTFLLYNEEKKARDIVTVMERNGMVIPPELQHLAQRRHNDKGKGRGKGKGGGKGGKGGKGFGGNGGKGFKGGGGGNHRGGKGGYGGGNFNGGENFNGGSSGFKGGYPGGFQSGAANGFQGGAMGFPNQF